MGQSRTSLTCPQQQSKQFLRMALMGVSYSLAT